jgi:hypothetical protein
MKFVFGLVTIFFLLDGQVHAGDSHARELTTFRENHTPILSNQKSKYPEPSIGIIVFFKNRVSGSVRRSLNQIYVSNGLRLRTYSSRTHVDVVDQKTNADVKKKINSEKLLDVCKELKVQPGVDDCVLNGRILPDDQLFEVYCSHAASACGVECQIQPLLSAISRSGDNCRDVILQAPPLTDSNLSLSTFWSQEYSGVDLAKNELDRILRREGRSCDVPVGVLDTTFTLSSLRTRCEEQANQPLNAGCPFLDSRETTISRNLSHADHGNNVANLINHPLVGASRHATFTHLVRSTSLDDYVRASEEFERISPRDRPRIYNSSAGWNVGAPRALAPILRSNAIMVTSAGNEFPEPVQAHKCESRAIVVGSMHPLGVPTEGSRQSACVAVSVGADDFLASSVDGASLSRFGQTSGAAPLVAGSLANVECLLPGLSPEVAETMLRFSSTPTLDSLAVPQRNGSGLLNSFALVKVAERIRNSCGTDQSCIQQIINNRETYNFGTPDTLHRQLVSTVEGAFPNCRNNGSQVESIVSCTDRKAVLIRLRTQALLERSNRKLWDLLGCVYEGLGVTTNANFYRLLALAQPPQNWRQIENAARNQLSLPLLPRLATAMGTTGSITLANLARSNEPYLLSHVTYLLSFHPEFLSQELVDILSRNNHRAVSLNFFDLLKRNPHMSSLQSLRGVVDNNASEILGAVRLSAYLTAADRREFLSPLLRQPTELLRAEISKLMVASALTNDDVPLLENLSQTNDSRVLREVFRNGLRLNTPEAQSMLLHLISSDNLFVQQAAAEELSANLEQSETVHLLIQRLRQSPHAEIRNSLR